MPQIQIVSNYFPLLHNLFKLQVSSHHLQKNENSVLFPQGSCYRCALHSFLFFLLLN